MVYTILMLEGDAVTWICKKTFSDGHIQKFDSPIISHDPYNKIW